MGDKPVVWVGSALDDLRSFPPEARRVVGYQIRRVQSGLTPSDSKPVPSVGVSVFEIRVHTELERRVFIVAKFAEAVYVLHAFEKRTRQTRKADIDLARRRYSEIRHLRARK
jgi:phage-related protein